MNKLTRLKSKEKIIINDEDQTNQKNNIINKISPENNLITKDKEKIITKNISSNTQNIPEKANNIIYNNGNIIKKPIVINNTNPTNIANLIKKPIIKKDQEQSSFILNNSSLNPESLINNNNNNNSSNNSIILTENREKKTSSFIFKNPNLIINNNNTTNPETKIVSNHPIKLDLKKHGLLRDINNNANNNTNVAGKIILNSNKNINLSNKINLNIANNLSNQPETANNLLKKTSAYSSSLIEKPKNANNDISFTSNDTQNSFVKSENNLNNTSLNEKNRNEADKLVKNLNYIHMKSNSTLSNDSSSLILNKISPAAFSINNKIVNRDGQSFSKNDLSDTNTNYKSNTSKQVINSKENLSDISSINIKNDQISSAGFSTNNNFSYNSNNNNKILENFESEKLLINNKISELTSRSNVILKKTAASGAYSSMNKLNKNNPDSIKDGSISNRK